MLNYINKLTYLLEPISNTTTRIAHKCLNNLLSKRLLSNSSAYDGDGKTTVRVLNQEEPHLNTINSYSHHGFRLSNDLFINGSILVFPTYIFSWNIRRGIDITPESLLVFDIIVPKVKILIIGYGQNGEPYDATIPLKMKKKGISCEMIPTPHAISTYNFLVHDSVHVAGAFVPMLEEQVQDSRWEDELRDDIMLEREWLPTKKSVLLRERYKDYIEDQNKDAGKKTFD